MNTERKQYVTVEEACLLTNRSERTIRRWLQKKLVRFTGNKAKGIYIDLDDLMQMQAHKADTIHPVRNEIKSLKSTDEDLEERIEALIQRVDKLQQGQDLLFHLLQQASGSEIQDLEDYPLGKLVLLPKSKHTSGAESRGLPSGTLRLAPYASQHKVVVSQIKSLFYEHEIGLIRHQREGDPVRNKQEWWISPEQQVQLVRYWQEHHVDYTPCAECQGCVGQMQNSEIG